MTSKRKKGLDLHVAYNDYFGTLAAVLDLMRQEIKRRGYKKSDAELLEKIRDDLMYLQNRYKIELLRRDDTH